MAAFQFHLKCGGRKKLFHDTDDFDEIFAF